VSENGAQKQADSAPNLWIFDSRIQMWSEEAASCDPQEKQNESQPWLTLLWDVKMRV
jgi:hypothetical protein